MNENYKQQSQKVASYYDEWQKGYNEVYGDFIQAFRPTDSGELMKYIADGAAIENGIKILDAGCGVGGPAMWLASNFDVAVSCITVSEVQVKQATESIAKENLSDKINVLRGDYHELNLHFEKNYFDRILFLESLGHSGEPAKAIAEAVEVLKPGGSIYIKDFYYKEPANAYWRNRIQKTIANINQLYSYNCLNLLDTVRAIREVGFEIEFIRKFSFTDDISIRLDFESRFGIDIFGGELEFYPAEWLEIKCVKPKI
jgi:cyclopropane fatty-acyl-phospholipid synthase-like methyltransferase